MTGKIAIPTDDGETISRHFGSARYFQVISPDGGQVAMREKGGHDHDHGHHEHGQGHGGKFELLHDCAVLIGAGMGQPAYDRLQRMGLEVILTGEKQIAAALEKYRAGTLRSDMRRVHAHHHHEHDHEDDGENGRQDVRFFE